MTYEQYIGQMMAPAVAALEKHLPNVGRGRATEPLHRTRVSLRRLRNALKIFKKSFSASKLRRWNALFRTLGRSLGLARDLDVQILFLQKYRRGLRDKEEQRQVDVLIALLKERRLQSQPAVIRSIRAVRRSWVLKDLKGTLQEFSRREKGRPLDHLAGVGRKKIVTRLEKMLALEKHLGHPRRVDELHRMRIAAKHLRYTLEGLSRYYGKGVAVYIAAVLQVHRGLGNVHDDDVWLAHLAGYEQAARSDKNLQQALRRLERFCARRRKDVYQRLLKAWDSYRRKKVWEGLRQFVKSPHQESRQT